MERTTAGWVYRAWSSLLWGLGLVPILGAITSPRFFDQDYVSLLSAALSQSSGVARWVRVGITGVTLGVAAPGVLVGLTTPGPSTGRRTGTGLWLAGLALAVGPILSSVFGLQPAFSLSLLGLPAVMTAIYLLPPVDVVWFSSQVKTILLVYVYGSLVAATVVPEWALEYPYFQGVVPGFNLRLHGLGTHANNLAPFAVNYLILSWVPGARFRGEWLHRLAAFAVLVLSQSKTAWVLFILACLIRVVYVAIQSKRGLHRYTGITFLLCWFVATAAYLASGPGWTEQIALVLAQRKDEFVTLTGRTLVWYYTTELWRRNPWFGYGPRLWDIEMRLSYLPMLGWASPHAHNQFYQTLGESGIVGIIGLAVYTLVITLTALHMFKRNVLQQGGADNNSKNDGFVVTASTMLIALLLRYLTEPPLRSILSDGNLFVHVITFAGIMLAIRQSGSRVDSKIPRHGFQWVIGMLKKQCPRI